MGESPGLVNYDPNKLEYRLRFAQRRGIEAGAGRARVPGKWAMMPDCSCRLRGCFTESCLQSLWELRLPWSQALVGIPRDWSDENQWYWTGYAWKRPTVGKKRCLA